MAILTQLFLAVPFLYAIVVACFIYALIKKTKVVPIDTSAHKLPGISIVIPFRNEAHNLRRLIDSLESQTYAGAFEIVLVNDGSMDDFRPAIGRPDRPQTRAPVRTIDSPFSPARRLTSKQQALEYGIKEAVHEWIALTDADMVLDPTWLETLMQPTTAGAKLVFGHTAISNDSKKSLFAWFQSFQLETLFSFAYAFHRTGITGSCMGNNLLISKASFLSINGFESTGHSIVEDMDLLAAFRKNRIPAAVTEPFHITALTLPSDSVSHHLQQIFRWGRGGFRRGSGLLNFGLLAAVHTLLFIIAVSGVLPHFLSAFLVFNQMLTWLFIGMSFQKIRAKENPVLFPLFFAAGLLELVVLLGMVILGKKTVWKEREL